MAKPNPADSFNLPQSFAILSDQNPAAPRNPLIGDATLSEMLDAWRLPSNGDIRPGAVQHWEVLGHYGGKDETSQLVALPSLPNAPFVLRLIEAARSFGQESILFSYAGVNVLEFCQEEDKRPITGKGYQLFRQRPEDNWTRLPNGLYLQVNLNF